MALTGDKPAGESAGAGVRPAERNWPVAGECAQAWSGMEPEEVRLAAETLDELKARWPAIGEAADHPLVGWFLRREPRSEARQYVPLLVAFLSVVLLCGFFGRIGLLIPMFLTGALGTVAVLSLVPRPKKEMRQPLDLLPDAPGEGLWRQIAVTPLGLRDIAGIHIGVKVHRVLHRGLRAKTRGILIYAGAIAFLAVIVGSTVSFLAVWELACPAAVLCWTLERSLDRCSLAITEGLSEVQQRVLARVGGPRAGLRLAGLGRPKAALAVVAGIINVYLVVAVSDMADDDLAIAWGTYSLLGWSLLLLIVGRLVSRRNLDPVFERGLGRLAPYYERLRDRSLGNEGARVVAIESSQPRAEPAE